MQMENEYATDVVNGGEDRESHAYVQAMKNDIIFLMSSSFTWCLAPRWSHYHYMQLHAYMRIHILICCYLPLIPGAWLFYPGEGGGLLLATTTGMLHQKDAPFWRWSRAERPPFLGCSRAERPSFLGHSKLINKVLLFYMQNFIFVMFVKLVKKKPCFSAKTLASSKRPCAPFYEKRRKRYSSERPPLLKWP